MIRYIRQYLACRKLQKLVEQRRNSYAVIDYRKRREAALRGLVR
jgi:hypothetical protein